MRGASARGRPIDEDKTLNLLRILGWSAARRAQLEALDDPRLRPARVGAVERNQCLALDDGEPRWATLSGRLTEATDAMQRPTVGDWVAVDGERVVQVFPRTTYFARKGAGRSSAPQLVCANIDVVFAVTTCGRDLNPRRVERYVAAIYGGGARPVVVLNKADEADDPWSQVAAIERVAPGVPVIATSALRPDALGPLAPWLAVGTTVALLGSSGVGKSTLVNRLLGVEAQGTAEVREDDERGRHTTTRRSLAVAPCGVAVVDTPGMRELGLWRADDGLDAVFADIGELASACRFRDCRHEDEPGCAVRAAVESGALDPDRLTSQQQLERELAYAARRDDARAARASERVWRDRSRQMRVRRKLEGRLGLRDE